MKLLGFLFRLLLVIALVVWLADRPGTAQIVWRDYVVNTSAAVLGVIVLALVYAAVLLHRLWRLVWDGPRLWRLGRKIGKLEEGQGEIARGFAALAAGEAAEAGKHAVKARKFLGETPVTRLIQAQAAQLAGDHGAAKSLYEALTQDSETAVLGYRGLITAALKKGDFDEASRLVHRLEGVKKDIPWLHVVRFELGARVQDWSRAGEALALARKSRALPVPKANRGEAALLLGKAQDALQGGQGEAALVAAERARKLAPDWLPASLVLAQAQLATGHPRAALRTVERAWGREPHPQLALLALQTAPQARAIDGFKLIERMARQTPDHPAALAALAEAAFKADLWGEARRFLMRLVQRGDATQATYQALARLERRETGNEAAASSWLSKAIDAPPEPRWLCSACGAAHSSWSAGCNACGAFDKMHWGSAGRATPPSPDQIKTEWLESLG